MRLPRNMSRNMSPPSGGTSAQRDPPVMCSFLVWPSPWNNPLDSHASKIHNLGARNPEIQAPCAEKKKKSVVEPHHLSQMFWWEIVYCLSSWLSGKSLCLEIWACLEMGNTPISSIFFGVNNIISKVIFMHWLRVRSLQPGSVGF